MGFWADYKKGLKLPEAEETFDLYFYRPLAYILVKVVYPFPITPNMLTAVSMITGIAAGICFSYGKATTTFVAGILFLIGNIFDCADGQLARLKKNGTKTGRIIDGIADYITGVATTVGIGIGYSFLFESQMLWWFIVVSSGIALIIQSFLLDLNRNNFIGITTGKVQTTDDEFREFSDELKRLQNEHIKPLEQIIIKVYLIYTKLQLGNGNEMADKFSAIDKNRYYKKNKNIIKGWTYIGSTTHISLAIITSIVNHPEYYFFLMLSVQNILAFILYARQKSINKEFNLA